MAADYTSVPEMKDRLKTMSSEQDENLGRAVDAAHVGVDDYCYRTFTLAGSATPRVFVRDADKPWIVDVDDISSTSGLVVADTGATYTQYELTPLNGLGPNGRAWPYTRISLATGHFAASTTNVTATVTITARWGWLTVPPPVRDACRILAGDLFAMNKNRFGVAGVSEMGVMRIRENTILRTLLDPYVNYRKAGVG